MHFTSSRYTTRYLQLDPWLDTFQLGIFNSADSGSADLGIRYKKWRELRRKGSIMPYPVLFGISAAFGLVVWGAVAWHYIWPALRERRAPESLKPILLLHAFRFLGLAFVLPGVVSPELPATFARPVAYGDFITAILALLALAMLGSRSGTALTWVFNTFGTGDLLLAFYLGSRISLPDNPGLLGAAYFILAAYVPLLLVTHGLAFRILARSKSVAPSLSKVRTA